MAETKGHSYSSRVAWSDTDTGGVAYFGAYARWVEYAEAELWRAAGLPMAESIERHGIWIPRVDFEIHYRRPLRYDEAFEVRIGISDLRSRAVSYEFEVVRVAQADVAARGSLRIAAVDRETLEGVPFPEELRERFTDAGYISR